MPLSNPLKTSTILFYPSRKPHWSVLSRKSKDHQYGDWLGTGRGRGRGEFGGEILTAADPPLNTTRRFRLVFGPRAMGWRAEDIEIFGSGDRRYLETTQTHRRTRTNSQPTSERAKYLGSCWLLQPITEIPPTYLTYFAPHRTTPHHNATPTEREQDKQEIENKKKIKSLFDL